MKGLQSKNCQGKSKKKFLGEKKRKEFRQGPYQYHQQRGTPRYIVSRLLKQPELIEEARYRVLIQVTQLTFRTLREQGDADRPPDHM